MSTTDHDDREVAERLRASLARRAGAVDPTSDADGLEDLRERVDGRSPAELASRGQRRTAFLAAAAIVLAVLGTGLWLVGRGGSEAEVGVRTATTTATDLDPRVERDEDGEWQTSRPHVNEGKNAGDLSELRFTLSVDRTSVAAGQAMGATLTVDNPTDHDIDWATCMERTLKRGLAPADDATPALPPQLVTDCRGTPVRAIGPGESYTFPLEGSGQALAARSPVANGMGQGLAGALAPGRYRGAVELFGRTSIVTVRSQQVVTVSPPPCPGFTDELVQRFRGFPTVSEAERRAAEIDMTIRVVQDDYVAIPHRDDLDCSRIDVVVLDDQVHDVVGVY